MMRIAACGAVSVTVEALLSAAVVHTQSRPSLTTKAEFLRRGDGRPHE